MKCAQVQADLSQAAPASAKITEAAKDFHASLGRNGELRVDILINNAGVSSNQFLNDEAQGPIVESEFTRVYNVNVLAPLLLTQALAPYFPKPPSSGGGGTDSFVTTRGRIVNVSSVSSSIGYEGQSVYAGTKAALEAMTRCWSRELAGRATVNAVNPGPAWGDMYAEAGEKFWRINQPHCDAAPLQAYTGGGGELGQEVKELMDDNTADRDAELKRFDTLVRDKMGGKRPGFTSEIAGTIDMLCSAEAGWTTGSVVCANGGMKMSIA